MDIKMHMGSEIWNKAAAFYVRMSVFVLERDIIMQDEFDEADEVPMLYVVAYDGIRPVATGRIQQYDDQVLKPGRLCVLSDYQGRGLGKVVLQEIEKYGVQHGMTSSLIHAAGSAEGFYYKLGYKPVSDYFLEDGFPCIKVQKPLKEN